MAEIKAQFQKAAKDAAQLSEAPDNSVRLRLYALYKQATEGDVTGSKPGMFDFVGSAKYEAWEKAKGMSSNEAMKQYVALVKKLTG